MRILVGCLMVCALAAPAHATKAERLAELPTQPPASCKPTAEMVAYLTLRFGETFDSAGMSRDGQVELWRSRGGRTWTLLLRRSDGTLCPLAYGENWLRR